MELKYLKTTSTALTPTLLKSNTPEPIPTSSKTPFVTPTTQMIMPSPTAISIIPTTTLLTPTYAPTMTELEKTSAILKLLRENAGCNLPCWWGFVPGITHWKDESVLFQNVGKLPEYYKSSYYLKLDIPESY